MTKRRKRPARKKSGWATPLVFVAALALLAIVGAGSFLLITQPAQPSGTGSGGFAGGSDKPAPGFQLPAVAGGTVSLDDFKGKKEVLLYFNMGVG